MTSLHGIVTELRLWLCDQLLMAAVRVAPKGREGDIIILGVHGIYADQVAARHRGETP